VSRVTAVDDGELPYTDPGTAVDSASASLDINGLSTADAKAAVAEWLAENGSGGPKVNFKLRDWLFARQRYWGEPFPVVYKEGEEEGDPIGIPETDLPLVLPDTRDFAPSGTPDPPLAKQTEWMKAVDPISGAPAIREADDAPVGRYVSHHCSLTRIACCATDVRSRAVIVVIIRSPSQSPPPPRSSLGSCWYYLRYVDPSNTQQLVSPEAEKYWMPVDLYVGGAEHAVLHLLYATVLAQGSVRRGRRLYRRNRSRSSSPRA
jgi:leucyl-tRNA synthetase